MRPCAQPLPASSVHTHTQSICVSTHQWLSGLLSDANHAHGIGLHQSAVHGRIIGRFSRGRDFITLWGHHVMCLQKRLREREKDTLREREWPFLCKSGRGGKTILPLTNEKLSPWTEPLCSSTRSAATPVWPVYFSLNDFIVCEVRCHYSAFKFETIITAHKTVTWCFK